MPSKTQSCITIPYIGTRPFKTVKITWFNINDINSGNISFTCFNNSLEGNSTVYSSSVGDKNVLKNTFINIGNIDLDINNIFTLFRILRNGIVDDDTFNDKIAICGVDFIYK